MNRAFRGLALLAFAAVTPVHGDEATADGCKAFRWNVSAERALFAGEGRAIDAGRDAATAPSLEPGRLAVLALPEQQAVQYARPPAKLKLADGAHGGLLRITVAKDGDYRLALSSAHWVDIVDGDALLPSLDFHGATGCDAPRKLVRYRLAAGHPLIVQFSGAVDASIRVALTPEP